MKENELLTHLVDQVITRLLHATERLTEGKIITMSFIPDTSMDGKILVSRETLTQAATWYPEIPPLDRTTEDLIAHDEIRTILAEPATDPES